LCCAQLVIVDVDPGVHVDPSCMTNGYIDMKKLNPIGRLNGFSYTKLGKIFERDFFDGQAR
jgi:hypothetical protein